MSWSRTRVLAALVGLAAAAPPSHAAGKLTVEDVFNIEYAADPQVASDGRQVAYVRQFADVMTDRRYSNIWIASADGTSHRPVTVGSFSDEAPRWSPDGTRLLYVSDRDGGRPQLHVRWMDTGQTARLTALDFPPTGPSWSPDGKWIAFISLVKSRPTPLAKLPEPPEGARWADPAVVFDRFPDRFNGPGLLPRGYSHVFVVPAEGGTPRQLTSGDFHHGDVYFRSAATAWTPDGKSIVISANRRPDWEHEPIDTEIHEVAVADGSIRTLTDRRGPDEDPAVSPDGRMVAYVGFDDRYQGYQVTRLHVVNRDGSKPRVLCGELDREAQRPAWAPDGSGVYFVYEERGNSKLAFCSMDGKHRVVAGDLGAGVSAYSGGTLFSVSGKGVLAFTQTTPRRPGDVAVLAAGAAKPRLLTALNDDLLSQRDLGEVEEIWYESSRDKRKIQGWIVKPPGFDPAKRYPLLLEIHGGPFADYGDRFDFEKQVYAGMGYVVVYANPRGSTSYGEEFGNLIHHAYPGDDFYDLDAGVDAVISRGYVDEQNLFVGGGSGGGVLTAWVIGRTKRFRAAAAYYPVINWISWVLTADMASYGVKYWFPGLPWDHVEHYMKRSLLSVVKNVVTPTLVITGEEDYRTPMSESEQYYTALKLLKVETALVRVPGEPHGIRRRPSHHMAKMLNIAAWFERYRKRDAPAAAGG
jgi:acylaminoacyl-peptidase